MLSTVRAVGISSCFAFEMFGRGGKALERRKTQKKITLYPRWEALSDRYETKQKNVDEEMVPTDGGWLVEIFSFFF